MCFSPSLPTAKGLRVRYNLTQSEEARLLHVSPSTIYNVENGFKTPSPHLVGAMCNLFQLGPNQFTFKSFLPLPKQKIDYAKMLGQSNGMSNMSQAVKSSKSPYKLGQATIRRGVIYFCLTKEDFIHEITVIRKAPEGMSRAFINAFVVVSDPDYDSKTLHNISGLSRSAINNKNSKSRSRNILVEYQFSTLLRLSYIKFQHANIRKHFNYNIPIQDADEAVKEAIKTYHIDMPRIKREVKGAVTHCATKSLANRMGVSMQTLKGYRSGFNVMSMTFREVVVLLDAYREYRQHKTSHKSNMSMTMPSGFKYHCFEKNGVSYLSIPLKRALSIDEKLHRNNA